MRTPIFNADSKSLLLQTIDNFKSLNSCFKPMETVLNIIVVSSKDRIERGRGSHIKIAPNCERREE